VRSKDKTRFGIVSFQMIQTVEYLNSLPPFSEGEELPKPWLEFCADGFKEAFRELPEFIAAASSKIGKSILQKTQCDQVFWSRSTHSVGIIRILPDDKYLARTKQASFEEQKNWSRGGNPSMGMELSLSLHRPIASTGDYVHAYGIVTSLELRCGIEMEALRKIHKDYRGIIAKLLEKTEIEFLCNPCQSEVDRVRSPRPIKKMDAFFSVPELNPNEQFIELSYGWYPRRTYDQGLKAFIAQAILFDCIQKAAVAPRSEKDHILDYWNKSLGIYVA
jgi:hypothetical protein